MNTLDRYILRQLITVTFLGVLSLTLLMLLGQLFKELHALLVESGAPPSIVFDFIMQVIPFSLSFSVPWGFLTALLLVYGRLAADNELTTMRMAGLSLWRLSKPAILMGIVLSALCYYINIEVAPRGKQAMSELVMKAAMDNPRHLLQASQSAVKLDKVQVYIEGRSGDRLYGVHIYPLSNDALAESSSFRAMHAQSAEIGNFDLKTRQLDLTMHHAVVDQVDKQGAINIPYIEKMPLRIHIPTRTMRKFKPNSFTNQEISETLATADELRELNISNLYRYSKAASRHQTFPCASTLWAELASKASSYRTAMTPQTELAFRTEGIQRASFACACFVFSLISIPLAITARRRDTTTGFAMGILIAAVYFVALVFCELSRKSAGITPYIVLWIPNIVCVLFAIWQHRKAMYRG